MLRSILQTTLTRAYANARLPVSASNARRLVLRLPPRSLASSALCVPATRLSHPIVGKWLLFSSTAVFAIVVVGGITRLTESGLSITEWNLLRGMKWPSSQQEWTDKFTLYQQTPEFILLNHSMSLNEFKHIFYWEWLHRNLGRAIGMVFLLPTIYFTVTRPSATRIAKTIGTSSFVTKESFARWMTPKVQKSAWLCCVLVGFQGALGWYMVKSGLNQNLMNTPNATPRVSQYRLASHLGSAFVIYVISLWSGVEILQKYRIAIKLNGVNPDVHLISNFNAIDKVRFMRFSKGSHWLAGLVFLTAISGAFVAGLDAGLVYNTWPLMGERFIPPVSELFPPIITSSSSSEQISITSNNELIPLPTNRGLNRWRNIFENPVTAQFDHRMLAYTTFGAISGIWIISKRLPLPLSVRRASNLVMAVALCQVTLGITTLIYFVPVELAVAHQSGSLILLTSVLWLMNRVRGCVPRIRSGLRFREKTQRDLEIPKKIINI